MRPLGEREKLERQEKDSCKKGVEREEWKEDELGLESFRKGERRKI